MNDAPTSPPALPVPALARWQPLRLGLVELYHYDCEELWFRDGHLLLRGNNGTGKSKVLSLTLPFLLDARLEPARVEPDADRNKRMEWNLLLGHLPQRTGYTWIEMGRVDEDGVAHYFTLGCGLKAVSGRPRVESWFFVTTQRVGGSLALVSGERVVLGRERLAEALAGHGQLFATAREYRRAVDERLFHLGSARYKALVDTLIELRQPQLSKQPDERRLSKALTDALPALPGTVLDDVAEAMVQLDDYREELELIERLQTAVARFGERYRAYACVQARREARVLRQAESRLASVRRALNAAREALAEAERATAAHAARGEALATALAGARAALEECRADPVMRDAKRLAELEQAASARARDAAQAQSRREAALARRDAERAERERREGELTEARLRVEEAGTRSAGFAVQAGVAQEHARIAQRLGAPSVPIAVAPPAAPPVTSPVAAPRDPSAGQLDEPRTDQQVPVSAAAIDRVRRSLVDLERRRREQIARLRERLAEYEQAVRTFGRARDRLNEGAGANERAEQRAREAHAALRRAAAAHCAEWRTHLEVLEALAIEAPEELLAGLEEWVESLAGPHPARGALDRAARRAGAALAEARSALGARERPLREEDAALDAEAARLREGEDRAPPVPYTRAPEIRDARPGAALWQTIEFREGIAPRARAGLEAALEASGLLDAWITPAGQVLDPATQDVWLAPRAPAARSLLEWLAPSGEALAVDAAVVEAVLAGVACAPEPVDDAEAWISPEGRFRVGPREGAWTKPEAEHIGFAARAAARERRLAEIALRHGVIEAALADIARERDALDAHEARITAELDAAPTDEALRAAHADLSGAERERRAMQSRLAELEAASQAAGERAATLRRALDGEAADLRLPASAGELSAVETALTGFAIAAGELCHAATAAARAHAEHAHQCERETQAVATLAREESELGERRRTAEAARQRHAVLRETMGAEIAALERRLAGAETEVRDTEAAYEAERERHHQADIQRARCEQKVEDAGAQEAERAAERARAVDRLRDFARTDLLRIAVPDIEMPDVDGEWSVDPALLVARRAEQALAGVAAEDADWERVQGQIGREYNELNNALSAQGERAEGEMTDFGLVVSILYRARALPPDVIERELGGELEQRRAILTAREREVLENHLEAEVAASLQRLLQEAERRVQAVNAELRDRPTSTGVRFRLAWETLPEGEGGAPAGLAEARRHLLNRAADAWSPEDRARVGEFLQARINAEKDSEEGGSQRAQLERALDYRAWHRFRVERFQDGAWRRLAGPASSGERALGLTVPLFAAASSHYASSDYPHAPRLVLLDEAFAGIDDAARGQCMALIREFDLDFVMTSEREWGCYAELPGVAICQLVRHPGVDAVHVSRWTWDGRTRRREPEPARPFGETARVPA